MLQRIMELPPETRRKYDTSSLRLVPASGSQLTGELANRFMDEFGDVICNLYGSTEVAWATIATPEDLRAAPGTAGRPPVGTELRILDEAGRPAAAGETGRIFVGNSMLFEGYTGGGSKEQVGALMSTGDVGRVDSQGRLFVEGRDDEMIVSGGENVFPHEVEELLVSHDGVADAAVIGVEDADFGQRLKAFIVKTPDSDASVEQLQAFVKANLARYKVPREIEFMDELPRNATGKVSNGLLAGLVVLVAQVALEFAGDRVAARYVAERHVLLVELLLEPLDQLPHLGLALDRLVEAPFVLGRGDVEILGIDGERDDLPQPVHQSPCGLRAGHRRDVVRHRRPEARRAHTGLGEGVVHDAGDAGRALVARLGKAELLDQLRLARESGDLDRARVRHVGQQRAQRNDHVDADGLCGRDDRLAEAAPAQIRFGAHQQHRVTIEARHAGAGEGDLRPLDLASAGPRST